MVWKANEGDKIWDIPGSNPQTSALDPGLGLDFCSQSGANCKSEKFLVNASLFVIPFMTVDMYFLSTTGHLLSIRYFTYGSIRPSVPISNSHIVL